MLRQVAIKSCKPRSSLSVANQLRFFSASKFTLNLNKNSIQKRLNVQQENVKVDAKLYSDPEDKPIPPQIMKPYIIAVSVIIVALIGGYINNYLDEQKGIVDPNLSKILSSQEARRRKIEATPEAEYDEANIKDITARVYKDLKNTFMGSQSDNTNDSNNSNKQ